MTIGVQVKVEGLRELRQALLRELPEALQGKALQGALRKSAALIVRDAKRRAPVHTGRMKRAIYSFRDKASRRGYEARLISVRSGKRFQKSNRDAYYWKFIEFGHRTRIGKTFVGPPTFVPPQPFMRPAFESQKLAALKAFEESLRPEMKKVAERAARRSLARLPKTLRRNLLGV